MKKSVARSLWVAFAFSVLGFQGCFVTYSLPSTGAYQSQGGWILTAKRAASLLNEGALLLDARKKEKYDEGHIQGAVQTWWRAFSPASGDSAGTLLSSDEKLQETLQGLGVSADLPVLVVGDALEGWGEDGRIVWMLRTLGHKQAYLVDGGFTALAQEGMTVTKGGTQPKKGTFAVSRSTSYAVQRQEVKDLLRDKQVVFVDTREEREFKGETPYGETRGGHVPGAIHLWFRDFLDGSGYLLSRTQLLEMLRKRGVTQDKRVVAYCTGGVRSAWFFVVLSDLGFKNVQNYAGSMWEWSAGSAASFPLVTPSPAP